MENILHVSDKLSIGDTIHGVTRLLSWWIPRFDPTRYTVSVCSLRKRDAAAQYLEDLGIKVYCLGRGKFDPLTLADLIGLIKREHIDLLHLHGYGATSFGRLAGMVTGIPRIVHEHMYDVNIPFYQKMMDLLLSHTSYQAIAVSESVKEFLARYRSIPEERIQVIYNGVPLEMFKKYNANVRETVWRRKLNIPPAHKVIGIVGRLDPIKGHCYFLQAAQQVVAQYKDVSFVIVGDGDLMPILREQCQGLGIADHVHFVGYCADVPAILSEMDIKVISSLSEGVPMTPFEAMAAGCGIVSTNVGGLGEVLEDGKTGFLVPPKDPVALGEKILLLLQDEVLLRTMSQQAKDASVRHDITTTVHEIEHCYDLSHTGVKAMIHPS